MLIKVIKDKIAKFIKEIVLQNEELDSLIICKKCNTLHKKVQFTHIKDVAYCSVCSHKLYRNRPFLIDKGLALCLTALILFIFANSFPIVTIDMQGVVMEVTLTSVFLILFENHFYFVGLMCAVVIFLFPMFLILTYFTLLILFKLEVGESLVKKLLIVISYLLPWNMLEIFLISILVALVKLIGYAQIYFGLSFWALSAFVLVDLYLYKNISMFSLWELKDKIYDKQ